METNQTIVRNYAAMTKELEDIKALFEKKALSEEEYNQQKDQILQDMHDYKYKKTGIKEYLKSKNIHLIKLVLHIFVSIFIILGLIFTILPMESFALAVLGIAIILALSFIILYKKKIKSFSTYLIVVALVISLVAISKLIFIKDEVVKDKQFENTIQKSQAEDLKELEGL